MALGCSWRAVTGSGFSDTMKTGTEDSMQIRITEGTILCISSIASPFPCYPAGISLWFFTAVFWLASTTPERRKSWEVPCISSRLSLNQQQRSSPLMELSVYFWRLSYKDCKSFLAHHSVSLQLHITRRGMKPSISIFHLNSLTTKLPLWSKEKTILYFNLGKPQKVQSI